MIDRIELLSLNCQKAYHPNLNSFLRKVLQEKRYDFLLLQEADERVLPIITSIASYKTCSAFNEPAGLQSHVVILYLNDFSLIKSDFISFSAMIRAFARRGEPGLLVGTFERDTDVISLGSLHLQPGFAFQARMREMHFIKEKLISMTKLGHPFIFGGDLNLGFPWEGLAMRRLLSPWFREATRSIGSTLDGRYTEKGTYLSSRMGNALASMKVPLKFKTDRVFVDRASEEAYAINAEVLPDRVSDHSPIRITLTLRNPKRVIVSSKKHLVRKV